MSRRAEVYRQPDRWLVPGRPGHPMGAASWDQDMVAGTKIALAFALDAQTCRAGQQQDPFVMLLTKGFVRRRALAGRDDPLDPQPLARQQLGEGLLIGALREVIEEIDHASAPVCGTIDRATSRAHPMNSSAKGLSVRPLTVMIPAPKSAAANLTGRIFRPPRLALNCATELGSTPTKRPLAIRVTVSWTDSVTMLGCGGCSPAARENPAMSEPGPVS